jgi:hypothetical protein
MARVTYQAILEEPDEPGGRPAWQFVPLREDAIATRRKDAKKQLSVRLSSEQLRWLKEIEELAGSGIDAGDVVRALLDVGRELGVDWSLVGSRSELRAAVRDAVAVRRPPEGR